jgi:hypothetical protein
MAGVGARQEHWDHPEALLLLPDTLGDRGLDLLVLPGAEPVGADQHHAGRAGAERLVDLLDDRIAREQVPVVEPRLEAGEEEPPRQLPGQLLVRGAVGQEDVRLAGLGGGHPRDSGKKSASTWRRTIG